MGHGAHICKLSNAIWTKRAYSSHRPTRAQLIFGHPIFKSQVREVANQKPWVATLTLFNLIDYIFIVLFPLVYFLTWALELEQSLPPLVILES